MSNVIQQWAPQMGFLTRQFPATSDTWSPSESPVARYILHLKVLGLEDPTKHLGATATEHYRQALALREHAITVAAKNDGDATIAHRLATGEIDVAQAERLLAKVPTRNDAEEQEARARQMLQAATRAAYAAAVRAIHLWGEDKWLALLRPLVAESVAAQDQQRWDALHDFAALLRSRAIGALAMLARDPNGSIETEETWRYTVGRPDRYHQWRLAHAEAAQAIGHEAVGPVVFVAAAVTKGPHPLLADMVAGEMEPGIFSAADVLVIKDRVIAEQEAARMGAEPPPPPARRRAEVS